jgi:short-subunit dehydrogenase
MAARGARVTLVSRRSEALEAVASEIAGGARVEPCDLAKLEEVEALAERLLADGATPDVLVNNAGAGRWLAVDETSPGEATQMIALPYLAAFELTRALLPAMIARGSGRIVCMTSVAGWLHIPGAAGYGVARWAMRALPANCERTYAAPASG